MERLKFIVRKNFPGEEDIQSYSVCIREVGDSFVDVEWRALQGRLSSVGLV